VIDHDVSLNIIIIIFNIDLIYLLLWKFHLKSEFYF